MVLAILFLIRQIHNLKGGGRASRNLQEYVKTSSKVLYILSRIRSRQ